MKKLVLYSYPPFVVLCFVQSCATKQQLARLGVNPFCTGLLLALGILLLPVWILALVSHIQDASADDDMFGDYSIDIHIGRGRKKHGSD